MTQDKQSGEVVVSKEVEVLANRIKENIVKIGHADRETLKAAVLIGTDLGEIQKEFVRVSKKGWQKWCEKNCEMTLRTIRNYVRVANASASGKLEGCSSLMEAYNVLRVATRPNAGRKDDSAVVTSGTIHDLKSLSENEVIVKVPVLKKSEMSSAVKNAWSKHSKEVKRGGHLILYLEIVQEPKKSAAKAMIQRPVENEMSEQLPASIPA